MDKSQFETTSFSFSPHPHRHLKSETYRSLIRILSHCYDHSQVSAPQEPTPEVVEQGELVGPDRTLSDNCGAEKDTVFDESFEAVGLENKGFGDTRMAIDEIQHIMEIEENDNLLKQKDLMTSDSADGTGSQEMGFDGQQMFMNELEQIVKGDGELVQENSMSVSVGENQSSLVALMNDQVEHVDFQQVVNDEFEKEAPLRVEKKHCDLKISEPADSSVDRSMDCQLSKPSDNNEDRYSLSRTIALEVQHEMWQKEMALEKLVHSDGTIGSHNCVAKDIEVEEGEISGVFEDDEASIDVLFDNALLSEEKKEEKKQDSEDVIDKSEFPCNAQNKANETFSEPTAFIVNHANSVRTIKLKESVKNDKQCESKTFVHGASMIDIDADRYTSLPAAGRNKRKSSEDEESVCCSAADLDNPTFDGEILEQSATIEQGNTSKARIDSGVCNKKKRSAPSKERKAKKKQKERKKRAEKNRQLGVKRLKLRPVLKPKAVTYCRHYLMGRCQEGDKCKFSHDTVPLTKSKPCCHFARNSCMKGDDCPFDHQLSKYPCNNFVAKGFCNRGDGCMFSHKMLPKEATPSASSALSNSGKVSSCKNTEHNVALTMPKPPALAPRGISCIFLGKSSVLESSKLKRGSLSPKRNDSGKVANQTEQTALGIVQNVNETSMRTPPAVASKGVNFLSFCSTPLEDSSSKKLASSLLSKENSVKPSPLNNFNVNKQAGSSHNGENIAKVGNQATHTVSSTIENSIEMLRKTHPACTPQGLNFLSIRKALTDDSVSNKASLPSSSNISINRSLQESQNTPIKHQNSSAVPWRSSSVLATGQSSNPLALGHCKITPNSSQKALMSTLAFAAKIETERKINLSGLSTGANHQTRDDGIGVGAAAGDNRGSLNDSAKASKILEFLSGVGKTKQ